MGERQASSVFCCPLCKQPLLRGERGCRCSEGHCFDLAAAGYTHLLPVNKKNSKNPGDDKEMVAARAAFLEKGYYAPLREVLCQVVTEYTGQEPVILDCGCGEGYYTAGIAQAFAARKAKIAGIDISKFAVRRAAKRVPEGEFAVASAYHLPLAENTVDILLNVFSPLSAEEFSRVLKPGGLFVYVVPSARHLWEMKEVLYEQPYENPVKQEDYPGFVWVGKREVRFTAALRSSSDIMALFGMTPYVWKTPKAGVERLRALEMLETQIGFDLHLYRCGQEK